MNEAITRIETAVDSQSELLAQLSTILDGKAAGGSGGSIETCSVTIKCNNGHITLYSTTVLLGSEIVCQSEYFEPQSKTEIFIENVVCNSAISVSLGNIAAIGHSFDNGITHINGYADVQILSAPSTPNVIGTATFYDNN